MLFDPFWAFSLTFKPNLGFTFAVLLTNACFCGYFPSAKIKNIIFTEEAKAKLLQEQRNKKKDHGTSFVPTNIAVNYVQHNRCKLVLVELTGYLILSGRLKAVRCNSLTCLSSLVYHEDANAPQRHHRHREEPKARPLRVGDTEKPAPECKKHVAFNQ